jgi:hypothetical protein
MGLVNEPQQSFQTRIYRFFKLMLIRRREMTFDVWLVLSTYFSADIDSLFHSSSLVPVI